MNITPEQFDRAFEELQQFGPRRGIPIEKRWPKVIPDVDTAEYAALKARCTEIEAFAYDLAVRVHFENLSVGVAYQQLAKEYPYLTNDRLSHTWSQAMYFAIK